MVSPVKDCVIVHLGCCSTTFFTISVGLAASLLQDHAIRYGTP